MADELIDIYDENNKPLHKQIMKSQAHKEGQWHRGVHIWIYNSKGEILLQRRAKDKLVFPGMWDVGVGGHISAGDEPLQTALREAKEELGIDIKEEDLRFYTVTKFPADSIKRVADNQFIYTYIAKFDGKVEDLTLQEEEVQDAKFFSIPELRELMETQPKEFPPLKEHWLKMFDYLETTMAQSKNN